MKYRVSDVHTFCRSKHPYEPFNIKDARTIIVGNTPPARFSTKELKEGDVDWYYGSRYNALCNYTLFPFTLLGKRFIQRVKV